MSKVYSAELHGNENASIEFGAAVLGAVQSVREQMAGLATSRKADEYAPGAIHALRKLCAGEKQVGCVYRTEVEEWQTTFFAWFARVKKHFPAKHVQKFQANAEDDFRTILKCAVKMPEYFWREEVPKRHIQISFADQAALDAARDAAEEKHPVDLGSALHEYLESCVAELVNGKSPRKTKAAPSKKKQRGQAEMPGLRIAPSGKQYSLSLDDFGCFDTPENLEQDIVVTAYDVEDALKKRLKKDSPQLLKALRFDCESSLFVVRSADPAALMAVVSKLYALAKSGDVL